ADDEVAHRAGHEHLAGCRARDHARGDMHGHAADVWADHLALAGMHAGAHIDAWRAEVLPDRTCAADSARRTVERRQEAVAERDLTSRPLNAASWRRTRSLWLSSSTRQRSSPSCAVRSVELVMSVNSTVASTRSGSAAC